MNAVIIKLLTSYMIMPLLAIIFTLVAYLISKKNKLFSNKKAVLYVLIIGLLLSIPGLFGFLNYEFMPYYYIVLVVLYLILGWFNIEWMRKLIPDIRKEKPYIIEFLVHFIIMFIGAGFFSMIFNLCNELQYGLWACTCVFPFVFPSLFYETYCKYLEIPLEIHNVWKFSTSEDLSDFEYMDYSRLTVMELEFIKQRKDRTPTKVKAKTPENMPFGRWFHKFIVDYNLKFPLTPIELAGDKGEFKWIFYVKRSFFLPRKYVDFELSIAQNKIKEKHTIVAKRVMEEHSNDENLKQKDNNNNNNNNNNI